MRTRLFAGLLALAALALSALPGMAITYGTPDGTLHPNVGALVQPYNGVLSAYCSGTLISPTVFLTAAHCGDSGTTVQVSFATKIDNKAKTYTGTFYGNPNYNQAQSDSGDIAVVVFKTAIKGITPAMLLTAGLLDEMAAKGKMTNQRFTSVGYGAIEPQNGPGGYTITYLDTREYAVGTFNALNGGYLRISQNPATGNAGTCYGDSGGPNFLGTGAGATMIAGITITGDVYCKSTNVTYRLDTASARAFLGGYVTLP